MYDFESSPLFRFATEGILVTNSAGEISHVNPAVERMFGYENGELTGKKIEVLVPTRFEHTHTESRANFNRNPHSRKMGIGMDLHGRRKDGSEFPVEVSLSPFSSGGNFVIAFIIDITARKKIEDEVKRQKEELEQNLKALEISNNDLEQFAYVASHDLQEPLRKIQSFGARLKSKEAEKLSDQGKDYVDRMNNAASRMQNLINDLLLFSRVTTATQPFSQIDLTKILSEVLSDMEITIEKNQARVESTNLSTIDADPTQMRQLFQNLISNSIKFRREEPPYIKIHQQDHTNNTIQIFFEDNGIGFNEKYIDKIFTIFQRLDGQKYEGSGIGLAVCKKIANRHGGEITVQSEIGKGTTFIVTLPIHQKHKH